MFCLALCAGLCMPKPVSSSGLIVLFLDIFVSRGSPWDFFGSLLLTQHILYSGNPLMSC